MDDTYISSAKYLDHMRAKWEGVKGICWRVAALADRLMSGAFYLDRTLQMNHIAGPFMTDGTFTKNTEEEVDVMMKHLAETSGVYGDVRCVVSDRVNWAHEGNSR